MLDRKSRVKIKQNDRRQACKRHSKEFDINDEDGDAIMGKCGTLALKALFMGKKITSPCSAYSRKIEVATLEKTA